MCTRSVYGHRRVELSELLRWKLSGVIGRDGVYELRCWDLPGEHRRNELHAMRTWFVFGGNRCARIYNLLILHGGGILCIRGKCMHTLLSRDLPTRHRFNQLRVVRGWDLPPDSGCAGFFELPRLPCRPVLCLGRHNLHGMFRWHEPAFFSAFKLHEVQCRILLEFGIFELFKLHSGTIPSI